MLYCTEMGSPQGDPILFLHAGSFSGTMWHQIAGGLPEMRCLLPDLPGHGYSRNIELQTLAHAADTVAALLFEKPRHRPVHLVGLSFGGYVGLILMARHPQLISRAMLSGIHLGAIPNPRMMQCFAGAISPLIRLKWFRKRMAASLGVTTPEIYDRADGAANLSPRTLRRLLNLVSVFDVQDLLAEINVPTLMIAGEKEHPTILQSLSDFQHLMPQCTARTVPELGHAWCNQDPRLFTETVLAWVNRSPLPSQLTAVAR